MQATQNPAARKYFMFWWTSMMSGCLIMAAGLCMMPDPHPLQGPYGPADSITLLGLLIAGYSLPRVIRNMRA